MNRFNLTFKGEVRPGYDPEQVKAGLAEALGIDDPSRLQECFSGDPVILGRNLDRKSAAELYARLHRLGAHSELVRIEERSAADQPSGISPPGPVPAEPNGPAITRRADLVTRKSLGAQDDTELRAKEQALEKALRAKQKQQARVDRASGKALAEQSRQQTRQLAAKKKAEVAAKKRLKAAARKAERERQKAEAAAHKAERDRQETEAAAHKAEKDRQETEAAAQLEAEQVERKRQAEQQKARMEAERERQARARQAEQQLRADAATAARPTRREQDNRDAERKAANVEVEKARRKREQAAEATRRKAEELLRRIDQQQRQQAEQAEQSAQRSAMEEQAVRRAALELAQQPSLKPVEARVKTRLELPAKRPRQSAAGDAPELPRKRQPGEPNLYQLTPFRNTPEIRARTEQSRRLMRLAYTGAAVSLVCLLLLAVGMLGLPTSAVLKGADTVVIDPGGRPVLQAGDQLLLHDRAGVGQEVLSPASLGLVSLQRSLAYDRDGALLATGRLTDRQVEPGEPEPPALLRCALDRPACRLLSPELAETRVSGLVVHPLDGTVFVADSHAGELLKISAEGKVLARAQAPLPEQPVLRLDSGLLLVSSANGPTINVFRYEDDAFGQQLDEIKLQPPAGMADQRNQLRDFVSLGNRWWVALADGDGRTSLYRFDGNWQFIDQVALADDTRAGQLTSWRRSVLVVDPGRLPVQRFNEQGAVEAPLRSRLLEELAADQQRRAQLTTLGWRIGLALAVLGMVAGLCAGNLNRVRAMVYQSCREQGAEPVDKLADSISWVPVAANRSTRLTNTGRAYAVLAAALLLGAIGLGVSVMMLAALLIALAGPALALLLLQRSEPGHIGTQRDRLLLVDHNGMYHLGREARIQYRGSFLMIDDVVVFCGNRLLPVFDPKRIETEVMPLAAGGIRVDRKILSVKMLQSRHPLALGAVAIIGSTAAAIALVSLHGIF